MKAEILAGERIPVREPAQKTQNNQYQTDSQYWPEMPANINLKVFPKQSFKKYNPSESGRHNTYSFNLQPSVLKALLLLPVLFTLLMARNYTGMHQYFINETFAGAMYVIFGSLLLSTVFFWFKPLKAVTLALFFFALVEFIHFIVMAVKVVPIVRTFSAGFTVGTLSTGNAAGYMAGAILSFLILWIIDSEKKEPYTEVY